MLTYADRESLLEALESLSAREASEDSALMARASAAIDRIDSPFGFADSLGRDVAALGSYLRQDLDPGARQRIRGALAFIAQKLDEAESGVSGLGNIQAVAFLSGLVADEIRKAAGQRSTYRPYRLSLEDRRRAEDLLLGFAEQPLLPDEALVASVARFQEVHSALRGAGIFGRLLRNLEMLTGVLGNPSAPAEHRAWCRAAFSYVIEEGDAIHDSLGLGGLLDDAFVVNTVVELLDPGIATWLDLLDAAVAAVEAWPFLNHLVFHDDESGAPVSEFQIINAALACPRLRGSNGGCQRTALVLPSVGPIPFLVSFMASLGVLQEWLLSERSPMTFAPGDTVCIDNEYYAHFDGSENWSGEAGVVLRYWDRAGRQHRQLLPRGHLHRLTPAPPRERPAGPVPRRWEQGKGRLSALEYLFHLSHPTPFANLERRVVLVAQSGRVRRLAANMRVCGLPLHDCFPVGHTTVVDGPTSIWSARFPSSIDPVLLVVPDLGDAALLVADDPGGTALVILDLRGANAGRLADLTDMVQESAPVLAITDEGEGRAIKVLQERSFHFWEWSKQELKQLAWPRMQPATTPLARYERRLRRLAFVEPAVVEIKTPGLTDGFHALQRLQELSRNREAGPPRELDEALFDGWAAFQGLLRFGRPEPSIDHGAAVRERVGKLEAANASIWLADEEKRAVQDLCSACEQALEAMSQGNPRAQRLHTLLQDQPETWLIVRNAAEREAILASIEVAPQYVLTAHEIPDEGLNCRAVIVGWLGRHWMLRFLRPPVADPLTVLLYSVERDWYDSLMKAQQRARRQRRQANPKQEIFPVVAWKPPHEPEPSESESPPTKERSLDAIDWYEVGRRRAIAIGATASTDGGPRCEAYLVLFTDGRHAFLTPHRGLAVVTSLLDRASSEPEDEVEERTVAAVRSGDVLLLPTGADRDVIRSAADRLLAPGDREQSTLWQVALRQHLADHDLTVEQLRDRLAAAGCRRHPQTIGLWLRSEELIAPQSAFRGDLEAIATATGDARLAASLEACKAAIAKVRHAHLTARRRLAEEALRHLASAPVMPGSRLPKLPIEGDLALVHVELVDDQPTETPRGIVNRVLEP